MGSRDVTEARADRCRGGRGGGRRGGGGRGGAPGAGPRVSGPGRRPPRRRGADGRPDPRPGGAQASQGARAQRRRRREGTRPHRAVATEARRGLHPAARGGRQAPALRGAREGRVHQLLGDLVPAVPRGDAGDGAPLAAAEGPGPRARRRVGRHRHEEGQALPRRAQAHVPGGARPEDGPRERVRCARGAVELRRGPSGPPHRDRAGAARVGQRRVPLADRRAAAVAMSESLGVAVAFSSGLFSFLSPCVLPLFPSYLSFITGMSVADLTADLSGAVRWRILGHALAFVVGFSIVFVALGVPFLLAAGALGPFLKFFRRYRPFIPVVERAAGLILVVVGVLVFTNYYVVLNAWAISLTPDWLLKRL